MENPVILAACRTPIGKFRGAVSQLAVTDLGATAIKSAIDRAGVDRRDVDEVIMGNVLSSGVGQAPARQAALRADLPHQVAAVTINKMCGSGLKAVMLAAQAIRNQDAEVIVAGGMESMSQSPYVLPREGSKLGNRTMIDSMLHDGLVCPFSGNPMGVIADALAQADGITRLDQDQYASESHRRAVAAIERGDFDAEMVAVNSGQCQVDRDEGPRDDTDESVLSTLKPVFQASGTVTAGNSSMISDGASALVVASRRYAREHDMKPLAEIIAAATSGSAPEDLFTAPVTAIEKVLHRSGLTQNDMDLIEINEAFAAQMLACLRRLEFSDERVNVNGGAIALGHPIGASGARVLTTLIHAMVLRNKQHGLASLCLGGGNAVAVIVARR